MAFAITGETGGRRQAETAASAFEAWLYGWTAFPVLLAFSLGLGVVWAAARYARWRGARPWLEQLAELHEEGVALRAYGQGMTETSGVPQFVRAAADWEQRAHRGIAERAKVEAVTFRTPPTMMHPELRAKYLSDEHRIALESHAERVRRLRLLIEQRARGKCFHPHARPGLQHPRAGPRLGRVLRQRILRRQHERDNHRRRGRFLIGPHGEDIQRIGRLLHFAEQVADDGGGRGQHVLRIAAWA